MNAHHPVVLEGTELWLLPEKAIYWPGCNLLLVADAHIGKAAVYRSLGQPVPHGTTQANLDALGRLLERFPGCELVFLGDLLHGPGALAPATMAALRQWRSTYASHAMTLIRGNHDHRAGDPPAEFAIDVREGPLLVGPFALQHEPLPHATHHVLAGHLHPVYHLRGAGRQRLRLPCFQLGVKLSVLPAFGAFTGGWPVTWQEHTRLYVAADGGVWPVPGP